ncbi:MAG: oligopeptide/dipeptide ABC transporter, ATP-binding protein, C-terminal domain protein [uncultured archaeon A07HR60]|nr:MAG: oligopeptide/dipeptide ABC transporter, ATP-binding protein, C-terminal domain protein [uncultured archaeon A07HR60]
MSSNQNPPLLDVDELTTTFTTDSGTLTAVDGIDFSVAKGETLCIVGESGSGKTVATESVTRIVKSPPGQVDGQVRFRGEEISEMSDERLRNLRGNQIAHIFQNPQDALNHCYTVGWQITEAIQIHQDVDESTARSRAIDLLDRVGIASASSRFDDYPHEFSGGQKQRVMIAMALVTNPDLLIADEPTTALDVTVQAQILTLLEDLQDEYGMAILFVTHDLGVVAQIADRIVVMYAGKVMERGDVFEIFETPAHPYTQALMGCLPGKGNSTDGIAGSLPDPVNPPDGCRFAPRCEHAIEECRTGAQPDEIQIGDTHGVSCVFYRDGYDQSVVMDEELGLDDSRGEGVADD